jgi:hypothetical protein
MFLKQEDLPSSIYGYQLEQITEGNDDIIDIAMAAAEEEVRSYLTGNNKKEWLDGRLQYDVDAILSAQDDARNALIVKHTVTITKWWIVDLCNADVIYEQTKERYDRAIDWLTKLAEGDVTLSNLPTIDNDTEDNERQPFSFGSRPKFNHY